jgi:hypothetical protein
MEDGIKFCIVHDDKIHHYLLERINLSAYASRLKPLSKIK